MSVDLAHTVGSSHVRYTFVVTASLCPSWCLSRTALKPAEMDVSAMLLGYIFPNSGRILVAQNSPGTAAF